MTEQEIKSLLEEIRVRSLSGGLLTSDCRFIEKYYERITFQAFVKRNCSSCYKDSFIEMYTSFAQHGLRPEPKFTLKNGVVLQSASFSNFLTASNLTDEKAIEWIRDNQSRITLFATYPENWKELIAQEPQTKTDVDTQKQNSETTQNNERKISKRTRKKN